MRFLFEDRLTRQLLNELEDAKSQRIDLVYYTDRMVPKEDIARNIASAPHFVLHVEKIISLLNNIDEVHELRNRLRHVINP